MGTWGTGIKQSDEFMEYYDGFFNAFKDGKDAVELVNELWNSYSTEFPEDIPLDADTDILHTVRFALALCLWECGVKQHPILTEVEEIIEKEYNLKFWGSENGGSDALVASRKKALERFLKKLHTEPRRIKTAKKSVKRRGPSFHKGDVFAYRCGDEGFRAAIILDQIGTDYLIAVSDMIYAEVPAVDGFLQGKTSVVFWMWEKDILPKKDRILIGNVEPDASYNGYAGFLEDSTGMLNKNFGDREFFFVSDYAKRRMIDNHIGTYTVCELLKADVLPKTTWEE